MKILIKQQDLESSKTDGTKVAFIGSTWSKNFYNDRKMYVMNIDGSVTFFFNGGQDVEKSNST